MLCRKDFDDRKLSPSEAEKFGIKLKKDGVVRTAFQLLSYPNTELKDLIDIWPELAEHGSKLLETIQIDATYDVYLQRQEADIISQRREESRLIPRDFDYDILPGLSNELKFKLNNTRPPSLAHANRIDGMTPAAIALLLTYIKRDQSSI